MKVKVYRKLALCFQAWQASVDLKKEDLKEYWEHEIEKIVEKHLPHGCGFDSGIKFSFDKSKEDRLVFSGAYHVMNEVGYYDGWIDFEIVVMPSLAFEIELKAKGRFGKNQWLGEYIENTFFDRLQEEVDWYK